MELLGVGPTEFLFIIIIILIVIGPKDIAKTGRAIGKWLNSIVQSDVWKVAQKTSKEIRQLPTNLMREANMEKFKAEINPQPSTNSSAGTWQGPNRTSPGTESTPETKKENVIQPPVILPTPATSIPAKNKPASAPRKKTTPVKKKAVKPAVKPATRKKSNA